MLTEDVLTKLSLDSLFTLMIEKIQEIKILRDSSAGPEELKERRDEIRLIQKLIGAKKALVPGNK